MDKPINPKPVPDPEPGNYVYKLNAGYSVGKFRVYQSHSGGIYMLMGDYFTLLYYKQILDLKLPVRELPEFNQETFQEFYKSAIERKTKTK